MVEKEHRPQNNFPKLPFIKSHAFIIGIDKYRDKRISPLKTAVNDAVQIAAVLENEKKRSESHNTELLD
ncbi:MAG: hypothetical protein ACE5I1_32975, partial [bacterium]